MKKTAENKQLYIEWSLAVCGLWHVYLQQALK